MTVHRCFDEARGVLMIDVTGDVGISDMMNEVLAWFDEPGTGSPVTVLVDLSEASWMRMYREYQHVSEAVVDKILEHQIPERVAFVLTTATERVMMGLINKTRDWPMEWGYFADREEAMDWLTQQTDNEP